MIEVATFFVDLNVEFMGSPGSPATFYRNAAGLMFASVKRVMPSARLVHLTDMATAKLEAADEVVRVKQEAQLHDPSSWPRPWGPRVEWGKVDAALATLHAEHGMRTPGPLVFCDTDIVLNRDLAPLFDDDFDVAVTVREKALHKRFNMGFVLSKPTEGARCFWRAFKTITAGLPAELHEWWGQQITMAAMLGLESRPNDMVETFGARVRLLPMAEIVPAPDEEPTAELSTYGVHFKGQARKPWMEGYARRLGLC